MKSSAKWIDRGWNKFKAGLKTADGSGLVASVGVQGDGAHEQHEGGATNVSIGVIHEYGSEDNTNPPARPHWAPTMDENEQKYLKELKQIQSELLKSGGTIKGQLRLVGEMYRGDVVLKIKAQIPPPLADSTIEQKRGETTPLDRTGQYINSFSVDVKDRSKVDGND